MSAVNNSFFHDYVVRLPAAIIVSDSDECEVIEEEPKEVKTNFRNLPNMNGVTCTQITIPTFFRLRRRVKIRMKSS